MNFLEKIGIYNVTSKEKELLNIIGGMIDTIEDNSETVSIKLNKNIFIETVGSMMTISSGYKIDIAKEIHLNPSIKIAINDTASDVDNRITLMKKENAEKYKQLKA